MPTSTIRKLLTADRFNFRKEDWSESEGLSVSSAADQSVWKIEAKFRDLPGAEKGNVVV